MHLFRPILALLLLLLATSAAAPAARACGPDSDCELGARSYRLYLPAGFDGKTPLGAIVYAHGYKGTAAGSMKNAALLRLADELGVAFVAATSGANEWDVPGAPQNSGSTGAAEFAYFEALLDDLAKRLPLDRQRLLMTGFSSGAMLVWDLACYRSTLFSAFVPMSGTFWEPMPETCDSPPTNILHFHGTSDPTVPFSGRVIADTRQGDVGRALDMYAAYGGYDESKPFALDDLDCKQRLNPAGKSLTLCLFEGGHSFSVERLRLAWKAFEAAGVL